MSINKEFIQKIENEFMLNLGGQNKCSEITRVVKKLQKEKIANVKGLLLSSNPNSILNVVVYINPGIRNFVTELVKAYN